MSELYDFLITCLSNYWRFRYWLDLVVSWRIIFKIPRMKSLTYSYQILFVWLYSIYPRKSPKGRCRDYRKTQLIMKPQPPNRTHNILQIVVETEDGWPTVIVGGFLCYEHFWFFYKGRESLQGKAVLMGVEDHVFMTRSSTNFYRK